jgi:hypothetical protein
MLLKELHFYDIALLGLKWLAEERNDSVPRARSIAPLIYTLRECDLITNGQCQLAIRNMLLHQEIESNLCFCWNTPMYSREMSVIEQIDHSDKHLILSLSDDGPYDASRLLGRNGYKFYLSHKGYVHAESVQQPITKEVFLESWRIMCGRLETSARFSRGCGLQTPGVELTLQDIEGETM